MCFIETEDAKIPIGVVVSNMFAFRCYGTVRFSVVSLDHAQTCLNMIGQRSKYKNHMDYACGNLVVFQP